MTRERAKELLPVIQAFAEGKTIEYRDSADVIEWSVLSEPSWADLSLYRIAPEPKRRPMTRGEVLYKVTTTPGMVVRWPNDYNPIAYPALAHDFDPDDESFRDKYKWMEWAIIDATGEPVDGWHKFEIEE